MCSRSRVHLISKAHGFPPGGFGAKLARQGDLSGIGSRKSGALREGEMPARGAREHLSRGRRAPARR